MPPPKKKHHDKVAECSLLAVLLLENESIKAVRNAGVLPHHFYFKAHQLAFQAMLSLEQKNLPLTLKSVADEIKNEGLSDCLCGSEELVRIFEPIFSVEELGSYIEKLKGLYRNRGPG